MNRITIQLGQHTPLIHFQHDQAGATLRATEVKPKLDKFILTQLGKGCAREGERIAKETDKKWCIRESSALDYKLNIQGILRKKYVMATFLSKSKKDTLKKENLSFIAPAPCFGDNDLYGCMYNNVTLSVFSFKKEIIKEIERWIIEFFNIENFGFRQSKGFGSFSVGAINTNKINNNRKKIIEQLKKTGEIYSKECDNSKNGLENILGIINNDYQLLKSGKTYPKYHKSKLAEHFFGKPISLRWEKRKIKLDLKSKHPLIFSKLKYDTKNSKFNRIEGVITKENENFVFARALLGLAEQIEFSAFSKNFKKDKIRIKISDKDKSENKIERFQSPLIFKVIDDTIYLVAKDIAAQMYDKEFSFTLNAEELSGKKLNEEIFSLRTPKKEQFNLHSFLDQYLPSLGWNKL